MAEYNFLFTENLQDSYISEETADDSGIDEELECLLYSQIHYDEGDAALVNDQALPNLASEYLATNIEVSPEKRKADEIDEVVVKKKKKKLKDDTLDKKKSKVKTKSEAKVKKISTKKNDSETKPDKEVKKKKKTNLDKFLVKEKTIDIIEIDCDDESKSKIFSKKDKINKERDIKNERKSMKRKQMMVEAITVSSDSESDVIVIDKTVSPVIDLSDSSSSDLQILSEHTEYDIATNVTQPKESRMEKERRSVQDILDSLEDCDWSVETKGIGTPNRYFRENTPTLEGSVRRKFCSKCDKVHISRFDCKRRKPRCATCCSDRHLRAKCPEVNCSYCQTVHKSDDENSVCLNSRKNRYSSCVRCKFQGHKKARCTDIWRQFHLTITRDCSPESHPMANKINPNMFCCNCASDKHFDYDCPMRRMYHWIPPFCPIISQYDSLSADNSKSKNSSIKNHTSKSKTKQEKLIKSSTDDNTSKPKSKREKFLKLLDEKIKLKKKKELVEKTNTAKTENKKKKRKKKKSKDIIQNAPVPKLVSFLENDLKETNNGKVNGIRKPKTKKKSGKTTASKTFDKQDTIVINMNNVGKIKDTKAKDRNKEGKKKPAKKKIPEFESLEITIKNDKCKNMV